jgi:hypothetical protein
MRCLAAAVLVASGCGYTLVSGRAPFGARTIAVVPFQEAVPVGLSGELSRELARLLAAEGVQLARNRSEAEAVLTGEVVSARTATSPVATAGTRIPAYNLEAIATARLLDGERELWSARAAAGDVFLPSESANTVETQTLETEANRRRALSRLAVALARELHQQLVMATALAGDRGD